MYLFIDKSSNYLKKVLAGKFPRLRAHRYKVTISIKQKNKKKVRER